MLSATKCKLCDSAATLLYASLSDRLGSAPGSWTLIRCTRPECGLIWIDPLPGVQTLTKAYETYYTHTNSLPVSRLRHVYLAARNAWVGKRFGYPMLECRWWMRGIGELIALFPHRRIGMEAMVLWLPWKPGGRLLEVGCGNGERMALLRDFGWTVTGLEPDAIATEAAINRGLDVRLGTLASSSFPPESFDAVLMSHVIEHMADPAETIRAAMRLLRPGGALIMLTPNTASLGHRWFGRNWLHLDPPRHLNLFSCQNLPKLCTDSGLNDIQCMHTPRDANWTLGASFALKRNNRYSVGQLPLVTRILGLCLFYVEWVTTLFFPSLSEEILVRAGKPSAAIETGNANEVPGGVN